MKRCALIVALLSVMVLAITSDVFAGTYQVSACNAAAGGRNTSWEPFNTDPTHLFTGQTCPAIPGEGEAAKTTGLYAADSLTGTGSAAPGATAGWRFTAPPDTTIVAVQADRYLGAYSENGWVPSLSADATALESCTFAYPEDACSVGGPFGNVNTLGANVAVNDASTLTSAVTCTASDGCVPGATIHHAWAALNGATVTLQEAATPTIASVSGALWGPGPADGFHHGDESLSFAASDPTGISQAALSVEGHVIATQTGACDFTYAIPCQGLTGNLALNTAQLADGPHTVTLAVYDAAGNEAQLTHPIVVDNTAPPPPTNLSASRAIDGTDTVTWADPAHAAPITGATYQLCPTSGGACQPPQTVPNQQCLTGLLPPKGQWTIKVWLTDAIGNVNPANAASIALPAPLTLSLHHRLKGQRLTIYVGVPAGVSGPVRIGYRAVGANARVLAHGQREAKVRRSRAQIVVHLSRSAVRSGRLYLTASADYALSASLIIAAPHSKTR
jgi:hypothetical protein